ncbi:MULTISPECIES: hypothetical protein [unclassified Cupriavidus]|uniref:hypothetical protein n=1 Tax=unclassified Cupriavidus TaxID=2640874 RepID=UPI0014046C9D|nr:MULTISPECIES: hypothetical protein [unclassified Cupriavidus]MBF6992217.1 hypothetical protein [Cupriavidus sp. IK-TO18]
MREGLARTIELARAMREGGLDLLNVSVGSPRPTPSWVLPAPYAHWLERCRLQA